MREQPSRDSPNTGRDDLSLFKSLQHIPDIGCIGEEQDRTFFVYRFPPLTLFLEAFRF